MKSVAELALEAGVQLSGKGVVLEFLTTEKLDRLLALHKAEVIKELCAGVEPVYQLRVAAKREDWFACSPEDYGIHAGSGMFESRILYPAETVAALQARVAELEKDAERLDWMALQVVEVRIPARCGSFAYFLGAPEDEEAPILPWAIRSKIDNAMREALRSKK